MLSTHPDLGGRLLLDFEVEPTSGVSAARLAVSTLANAQVEACVVEAARGFRFPQADAPTRVRQPFVLLFRPPEP